MREIKLIEPKGKRVREKRDRLGSVNGADQTNQANPRPTGVLPAREAHSVLRELLDSL